jgi:hypothetical protein
MKKILHFTVTVAVDDNGQCLPRDIGEGIQHGIDHVMGAGCLTRTDDTSTIVRQIVTCYSHSEDEHGNLSPEIHRTLFCPTSHLMASTNEQMLIDASIGIIYNNVEFGYLIRVPETDEGGGVDEDDQTTLSPDIAAIILAARSHCCKYVRLDQDATPLQGLPTYEW